jgi:hypothetical protein
VILVEAQKTRMLIKMQIVEGTLQVERRALSGNWTNRPLMSHFDKDFVYTLSMP